MISILRINKLVYGVLIGLLLAVITVGFVMALMEVFSAVKNLFANPKIPYFLAIIPNLLIMRYYFVNLKLEKAGRGILLLTFVWVILVFLLI